MEKFYKNKNVEKFIKKHKHLFPDRTDFEGKLIHENVSPFYKSSHEWCVLFHFRICPMFFSYFCEQG